MIGPVSELKVLLVDDDAFMINLTKRILRQLGIESALDATDGELALDRLNESTIDVIVCDLNMPGMDGLEFLRHLAGRESQPAVILLSGEDKSILRTAEQLAQAHKLRILGALSKPIKKEPFEALLEKVAASQTERSQFTFEQLTPDEIREGLQGDAVTLVYQPKIAVAGRELVGVESLVRWRDPERGLMGPGALIPVAEESGLINDVTEAVFKAAMAQCGAWRADGFDLKVAVNVSVENLDQLDFPEFIVDTAAEEGVPPSSVVLEVTESRIMADIVKPLEILTRLRMKGVGLSIDDFGTGASSMQQLKRIPFTEIKIDREFVAGAADDEEARAMLVSSIGLGKDLGLSVVAEGVETQAEWDLVASLGVNVVQGYLVAKAMPGDAVQAWLEDWSAKTVMRRRMAQPHVPRRLAAILAADVVGYSRLMGADEEGTLERLNDCRAIIDGLVKEYEGRVFGSAGDSVIAEFASPVEAVRCAVEIQQKIDKVNAELPKDRCMRFRIGVNLGDVMVEGTNLFGDGVNVAARLQEIAKPGGLCVSADTYHHVRGKLSVKFEDLGEKALKNIAEPIRVYRVEIEAPKADATT